MIEYHFIYPFLKKHAGWKILKNDKVCIFQHDYFQTRILTFNLCSIAFLKNILLSFSTFSKVLSNCVTQWSQKFHKIAWTLKNYSPDQTTNSKTMNPKIFLILIIKIKLKSSFKTFLTSLCEKSSRKTKDVNCGW